jgi:TRAP-type C4-dicarboxylate transport system permease small subunit
MNRFEHIVANIFGVVFLALSLVVTVETVARKLFTFSIQGADELGGYALAIGSTLAFSLALIGRNHIRVDVFHERFPPAVQAVLNWLSSLLLALFTIVIVVVSSKVLRETVEYGSTAQTPWATPLIWPQSLWYAAFVAFMVLTLWYAGRATLLLFSRRIDELNVEFHPKSAKEELKEELDDLEHRQATEALAGAGDAPPAGSK